MFILKALKLTSEDYTQNNPNIIKNNIPEKDQIKSNVCNGVIQDCTQDDTNHPISVNSEMLNIENTKCHTIVNNENIENNKSNTIINDKNIEDIKSNIMVDDKNIENTMVDDKNTENIKSNAMLYDKNIVNIKCDIEKCTDNILDEYDPKYRNIKYNKKLVNLNNKKNLIYTFTLGTFKHDFLPEILKIKYINKNIIEVTELVALSTINNDKMIKILQDETQTEIRKNVMCQIVNGVLLLSEYGIKFNDIKIEHLNICVADDLNLLKVSYNMNDMENISWIIDNINDFSYLNNLNLVDYKFSDKESLIEFIRDSNCVKSKLKINLKKEKLKLPIEEYLKLSVDLNLNLFELFTLLKLNLDNIIDVKLYLYILSNLYRSHEEFDVPSVLLKYFTSNSLHCDQLIKNLFILPIPKLLSYQPENSHTDITFIKKLLKSKKLRTTLKNQSFPTDLLKIKISDILIKSYLY